MRTLIIVLSTAFIFLFLFLSVKRLSYPGELEWMEGSIVEHAERVYNHEQLYTAPSVDFVNWLYPPLYYYATAAMMNITGVEYLAGRLVSFISIIVVYLLAAAIVQRYTNNWLLSLVAAGMIAASYHWTGYSYDIARLDSLHILLILCGVALLQDPKALGKIALSAVCFSLAFFTKQQAVYYFIPAAVWLFVTQKRSLIVFGAASLISFALGSWYLIAENGGWYWFYVYTVPAAKASSFLFWRVPMIVPEYLGSAWTVGTLLVGIWIYLLRERFRQFSTTYQFCLLVFYGMSVLQLAFHIGDGLSYKNIAAPYAVFFAIVVPIAAQQLLRMNEARKFVHNAIYISVAAQLLIMLYNPLSQPLVFIKPWHEQVYHEFIEEIRQIPGSVRFAEHTFLPRQAGKKSYANELALYDVSTVGDTTSKRLLNDWERAHREGKFDYVLRDAYLYVIIPDMPGYTFDRLVNVRKYPFHSRIGDFPSTPRFLYRFTGSSSSQ